MNNPRLVVGLGLVAATLAGGCQASERKESTTQSGASLSTPPAIQTAQAGVSRPATTAPHADAAVRAEAPTVQPGVAAAGPTELSGTSAPVHDEATEHAHGTQPSAVATNAWKPTLDGRPGDGLPRWPCRDDHAFRPKTSLSFADPTPRAVAEALTETAKRAAPLSLVLQHRDGELLAALAATRNGPLRKEVFLPGEKPVFAPLVLAFGDEPSVTTARPLPSATLQLFDKKGPLSLPITRLLWRATTTKGQSCDELLIDVHATVAVADLGLTLHLAQGDKTLAALVGSPPSGDEAAASPPLALPLHFTFTAASAAFDASSL